MLQTSIGTKNGLAFSFCQVVKIYKRDRITGRVFKISYSKGGKPHDWHILHTHTHIYIYI